MSATLSLGTPISISASAGVSFTCLTGFVQRRSVPDIFQRGTHLLVNSAGQVIAVLRSTTINLFGLEGRFLTVCGINEGLIEGVPSILVTQVFAAGGITPQPQPIDLTTLLLLLLRSNPNLLFLLQSNPNLFLQLLNSGLLGGLTTTGLTTTGLTGLTTGTANVSAAANALSTLQALGLGTSNVFANVSGI